MNTYAIAVYNGIADILTLEIVEAQNGSEVLLEHFKNTRVSEVIDIALPVDDNIRAIEYFGDGWKVDISAV